MDEYLTRDAEKLLAQLYKRYLEARKSGSTRQNAKFFGSSADIKESLDLPDLVEDVDDYCFELSRHGYLDVLSAGDMASEVALEDVGIAKLERRFTDGLRSVVDFIAKFL